MDTDVTLYTTPMCHYCQMTKEFLNDKGVTFTEHNVAEDAEKRQEMVQLSGQMGVPVIKVGDEVMVGFDKGKLAQLVGVEA